MDLPAEAHQRWILHKTATLLAFGAEPVNGVVTPTSEHFPDAFDGTPQAVERLLRRIQKLAGLGHLTMELSFVAAEGSAEPSSCSSGGCGGATKIEARLDGVERRSDGSYGVQVHAGEIGNPVVLTTRLVRAVAFVFLSEAEAYADLEPAQREAFTDLAAIMLGFGPLIANGSYIFKKGCSGVAVHSATQLPVDQVTLALAIFCALHGVAPRQVSRHLDVTPRAHFDESAAWAASNAPVIRMLRSNPEAISRDLFALAPARSWLARALGFGRSRPAAATDEDLTALERDLGNRAASKRRDPEKERRLAELRSLVDESLDS
jgi:hypothetical protein